MKSTAIVRHTQESASTVMVTIMHRDHVEWRMNNGKMVVASYKQTFLSLSSLISSDFEAFSK
jgi:hypothetical protein